MVNTSELYPIINSCPLPPIHTNAMHSQMSKHACARSFSDNTKQYCSWKLDT